VLLSLGKVGVVLDMGRDVGKELGVDREGWGEMGWDKCGGMQGGIDNTCAKWHQVLVGRVMQRGEMVQCPGKSWKTIGENKAIAGAHVV